MLPHECQSCGLVDESKFKYAGPHIKQVCNGCNSYVKFYSKWLIPDPKEIVLKIQSITMDIDEINEAKKVIGFVLPNGVNSLDKKIMYWRLYLQIRKEFLCRPI